jgi:glyoxylase-like metal-dependent hydrolase (beta-lactamase superfamily II)
VLITHPHPDHVGGLPALLAAFPDAVVATSARTAEVMRTDEGGVLALARSFLGDDFAAEMPAPMQTLPESGILDLAGLRIRHAELGTGETVCATMFVVEGTSLAFIGDVAANALTPWLVEGHSAAWLEQIGQAEALLPPGAIAHPGHGEAAEAATLLAAQCDVWSRDLVVRVTDEPGGLFRPGFADSFVRREAP